MRIRIISFFAFLFLAHSAWCLTDAERTIVKHVQELNTRQKTELDDTKAKLTWVYKELSDTQPKIDQLGKERDQYKNLYESDHESLLKAKSAILRRDIIIGILGLISLIMIVLKFKLYRFIPGLGLAP